MTRGSDDLIDDECEDDLVEQDSGDAEDHDVGRDDDDSNVGQHNDSNPSPVAAAHSPTRAPGGPSGSIRGPHGVQCSDA